MTHSNTGIADKNWNPDGPKNAPDSWPSKLKNPPIPCHDSTRPLEARGTCNIPFYKLESDCIAGRGTWFAHHQWSPGEPACCGGFNYDGTEQGACMCGPGTNRPCRDCPHDCRVVIGRYPFDDGSSSSATKPGYLTPIFGCSTEEYCTRADNVYPWVTSGCDCCGPCCPSMIGVNNTYEHESFATLDTGRCYPLITHGGQTTQSGCERLSVEGVKGTWISTDEDIPAPVASFPGLPNPDGVCFESGPILDQGQVLLPGGSRKQTGAMTEATCNGVWVPITRLNSSPPGCIPPNKCSDNCGGSQVGVCHAPPVPPLAEGPIIWGTSKGDCISPNVWSEDACHTQPPCCEKRGSQLYAKEGFETLKAQISGCSCPGGGVCETDLVWLGGAGLPISISPWEKFGGIDPYKEVYISLEGGSGGGVGAATVTNPGGDFLTLNTINLESTCGVWGGTFGTCDGCGHYVALYDVDCPNCSYTAHPLSPNYPDTTHKPPHVPDPDNTDPFVAECLDFPATGPSPECIYTLVDLRDGQGTGGCHKCCAQEFGPPHGNCAGTCQDSLGNTIQANDGWDCTSNKAGSWVLDCMSGGPGGGAPDPGIDGPGGNGSTPPNQQSCGINCNNPPGGFYQCDCADSKEMAIQFGIPLCRTVKTHCGDTKCTQDAWVAPGTCCDWFTVEGSCETSSQIINRGQRCGNGTCDCCEACPSCISDSSGNLTPADRSFDRDAVPPEYGDWCRVEEEGSGCSLDVDSCHLNGICHPSIQCNGTSPIGEGIGARCKCPGCPPPPDECPYYACRVGNVADGDLIRNAPGNHPPDCMCGMGVAGLIYHHLKPPQSIVDGKGGCTLYCDGTAGPYWAAQLCETPVSPPEPPCNPAVDDCDQPPDDLPGQGGGGGGGGGGGESPSVTECAGCGEIYPRLIADCTFPSICGCGQSDWTGRCDGCGPSTGSVQTIYLICHQEASCKEDCDGLGVSREWRGECNKERCGAKKGGTVCVGGGSQYWPPDPPHGGNDGKFRWNTWGNESECPCGPDEADQFIDCECKGPTPGQVECMGATGRCGGGPHLEGLVVGGTKCQDHWKGTDRYACGHEWFTPPWGWPPVCGGSCGTHEHHLTESSEAGVCQWPGPANACLGTGNPPLQQHNMIDLSSPLGTARDCMSDPETDGRCSCEPGNWGSYSTKTECMEAGFDWITNTWITTNGVCWHRAGHRVFTDNGGDLITDETTCLAMGSCTNAGCQGSDCDLPACAAKWSTLWRPQNDPYWHDTVFAIANQQQPSASVTYPKSVSLLGYEYGGLGDSCYDGCMCGSVEPTCTAGGGCPDMPNCLGACFSCEGNEWEITEAECIVKIAECTAQGGGQGSGGPPQTGGGGGSNTGTPGGYGSGTGSGGGAGGAGGGGGGGDTTSYDWKPNPFDPQGCFVPDEICKGCLTCDGNNADVCGGCGGKACAASGASGHRPHCLSKRWCDEFPKIGDCGSNCGATGCTGGGCGNYNPWNWKHRLCGKTCNQFHVILNGATYKAGYEDGAIKHLSKPNCRLFAPDSCCPDTIYLEGEDRPAPFIRIAQIDVEDYGEGYTIPPTVTIDDPAFVVLPVGIKARATSHIDKDVSSADYGKLTEISIANKGLGYADPDAAAPDPVTVTATLSGGCPYIVNGVPNPDHCGVCSAREHKTKTECENNVGTCVDRNSNEVHEYRRRSTCEGADSTYSWIPSVGTWTPMRQGSLSIRLEAWAGDCERAAIVDKDQKFKNNAACDCIPFNDCIPGNPPDADKSHRFEDYICDDIMMTSWEKLGSRVKTGNMLHIWKATDPKRLTKDPDTIGAFMSTASSINGDYEIQRLSSGVPDYEYKMKLLCSGREVSAFQPECQAGYCKDCQSDKIGASDVDCCQTGKNGTDEAICRQEQSVDSHGAPTGGCEGEWVDGNCGKVLLNCPSCDARGKCLYNGKCKDTNGDRNIHNGKCLGNEAHDAEHCTDPNLTLEQNITQCKENCLDDNSENCWIGAVGCLEECCGCDDCQDTGVGLRCPDCCWDVDAQGRLSPCDGGCEDQVYRTKVDCEANNKIWKEGTECPNDTHPNGPCPPRREDCCDATCPKDNIITEVDAAVIGLPVHPHTGYSVCANLDHPDFGGFNAAAYRGLPSCEKCTNTWSGEWDEEAGVCRNISTYKFKCGSYDHLTGGQETEWESGCCEERDCEADTCGGVASNRGDCCGLWSTSACACPSNYKDCDGNLKINPSTHPTAPGEPARRPFVIDLAIDGGAGGCCGNADNVVGLVPGTAENIGSFPQTSSRITITEA